MKLQEKISTLRRRQGWSQEELAEHLGVSRQSVSKWESGASTPELERIVQMCNLFGLTADTLIRDDLDLDGEISAAGETAPRWPVMTLDDVFAYIAQCRTNAHKLALGVGACVLSPAPLLLLMGMAGSGMAPYALSQGLGLTLLLLLVAWAVYTFIMCAGDMRRYQHIERRRFTLAAAACEWVEDSREKFRPAFTREISIGVMLCIVSPAPLMIFQGFFSNSMRAFGEGTGCALLLAVIACGVYLFVRCGFVQNSYARLLKKPRTR